MLIARALLVVAVVDGSPFLFQSVRLAVVVVGQSLVLKSALLAVSAVCYLFELKPSFTCSCVQGL